MSKILLPKNTTIGIMGDGMQTQRLALEARYAGFGVGVYGSVPGVSKLVDFAIEGDLKDLNQLRDFARHCDLVIYTDPRLSDQVINYIERFTEVPQGTEILDLIHDRSIQYAFLDMINVKALPYRTVVGLKDIQQGVSVLGYPAILKPIQTSILNDQQLIINGPDDIAQAAGMLRIGTYILEPMFKGAQHFSVSVIKSRDGSCSTLPIVEAHYDHGQLFSVNATDLKIQIRQKLATEALKVARQLHYVGGVEVSFVLSKDHGFYVDGVEPALNLASSLLAANGIDVYQSFLKAVAGVKIRSAKPTLLGAAELVNPRNYQRFQQFWSRSPRVGLYVNQRLRSGYAVILTDTPKLTLKKLSASH